MYKKFFIPFVLLLTGAFIYAIFRQDVVFLSKFSTYSLASIKVDIDYSTCILPTYLLIFCLPDALWYAALIIIQSELYEESTISKFILFISISLPFIYEAMQITGFVPGTFDWLDLLTYTLTLIITILCLKKQFYRFLH